jgi:hypothetical protein
MKVEYYKGIGDEKNKPDAQPPPRYLLPDDKNEQYQRHDSCSYHAHVGMDIKMPGNNEQR